MVTSKSVKSVWVKSVWVTEKEGSVEEHLPIAWLTSRGLRGHGLSATRNIFPDISS